MDVKVAISLIFACRQTGRSVKPDALIRYLRTTPKEISNSYKELKKTRQFKQIETRIMPEDKVKEALSSSKLNFAPDVKAHVKKAAIVVAQNFIKQCVAEGKKPATLAGVAIFMVALKLRTHQHD
jgi:transcription initiation factor TFIIIB Brf1 subunit/transcription initiation factor TFIIB